MTAEEFLRRVRDLLPAIRERATQTEQLRRLPEETFKALQEGGLLRCLQPKRYGGFELDPQIFFQAVLEISAVCGSTGWVFGVVGVHNWQLALFPAQAQDDVWGEDSRHQLSSSYAPTGTVERADGGFRLSGRWSFSSGCDYCHWVLLGGIVPREHEDTPTDMRTFLVPRSDYEIDDNWYVTGLCGSGSKDIVVENAFVPEYRTQSFRDARDGSSPGLAVNNVPLYHIPFGSIFPYAVSAPSIGIAQGALALFREQAATRVAKLDNRRMAEDPFTHFRLAEATAIIDATRQRMYDIFDQLMASTRAGEAISLERRSRYRWDAANAVAASVRATDMLFEASGGRAIFLSNPIQRAFRDVHAIRAHGANVPERFAGVFGRSALGLPNQELFI